MGIMKKTVIGSFLLAFLLHCSVQAMTLKESLGIALQSNPSVITAQKKVAAADAKLGQAIGMFMPTIKIDGSYGKLYTQPSTVQITTQTTMGAVTQTMSFGTNDTQDLKSLQASLSQPVFVAALLPGYKIAQKNYDLAKEDLAKTVLDTSFNVTQAYYGVLKAIKMVKLADESRQMAQSHVDQVKAMLAAGVVTKADLLRSEVQLANAEVGLTRAKNGLEIAKDAFNNALGNNLEQAVDLAEEGLTGTVAVQPRYKDLMGTAFNSRPDWKQYLLSKGMSEDNLRVAQTAYLPTVMLSAVTGKQITENPAYSSDVNSWSIVGAASWTLFDGLGIQNRIREAAANLEAQKATEEQVRNGIELEVRDAYLNLVSALETIGSTKKAVASADEGYKVSSLRYNSGVGTNLEVLDAQVALTQAKNDYLQSLFDVEIAKAKINKVVGKGVL
ncbi:MAG: TolC family protein [Candidatus Margulisbacteria bacterium]|nr:TolC family protein [Candidatus Margulisiibacteriota bacterium]